MPPHALSQAYVFLITWTVLAHQMRQASIGADAASQYVRDIVQEAYCRIICLEPHVISHLRAYLYKTSKNMATGWICQRFVRKA